MKRTPLPLATAAALLLAGCATPQGPQFHQSADASAVPPRGQALVFLVRPPRFVGGANSWIVKQNGQNLVTVSNGGYYLFTSAPGTLKLTSRILNDNIDVKTLEQFDRDRDVLRFEAHADTTHYLKLSFDGQIEELPPSKGHEALAKCWKIQP